MNFYLINRRGNKESLFLTCLLESRLILCLQTFRLEFRLYATQQRFCVGLHRSTVAATQTPFIVPYTTIFIFTLVAIAANALSLVFLVLLLITGLKFNWRKVETSAISSSFVFSFLELEEEHESFSE